MGKHDETLFIDDRPEGGERPPIVRVKDSGIDTDPRIDWGYPRPNDLDTVRTRMGEEAIAEAEVGLREARRREAFDKLSRDPRSEDSEFFDVSNYWDESLEDVA